MALCCCNATHLGSGWPGAASLSGAGARGALLRRSGVADCKDAAAKLGHAERRVGGDAAVGVQLEGEAWLLRLGRRLLTCS
jgi:hypothetical protein